VPRLFLFLGLVFMVTGGSSAQDALHSDAAAMEKKLAAIETRAEKPPPRSAPALRTSLIDREINAYFKVHATDVVPDGLLDPQVTFDEGAKVHGRAIADIESIRKQRQAGWFDPLAIFPAKAEITIAGTLQASDGKGVFSLESATLNGVSIPPIIVQLLVGYFSKTPDHPNGYEVDKPFEMPSKIRSLEIHKGSMLVVQ
jgi:hypothetical protein